METFFSSLVFVLGDAQLSRLAVDHIKETLYFTDYKGETSGMVNTDGSGRHVLFNGTGRLRGLAVDFKAG